MTTAPTTPAIRAYDGPLRKIGVIGAGMMASQFAVLFALRLDIPVVITDLDSDRVAAGIANAQSVLDRMISRGRLDQDRADQAISRITGTLNGAGFADADWVIEAVFEDLAIKQAVLADYEKLVGPTTVLATNTSSLSVEQIGAKLEHPERLVGFHFFNPVAVMRLIEVVRAPATTTEVVQTAVETAKALGKTPVVCTDTAGFLVNRLLTRVLAESWHQVEAGVPIVTVDAGIALLEAPMTPFELLEMVGPKVGGHVLESHRDAFGDRYRYGPRVAAVGDLGTLYRRGQDKKIAGPTLEFQALFSNPAGQNGAAAGPTVDQVGHAIAAALADEVDRMLREGVAADAADIDTAMTLAAGYPARGITTVLAELGVYPVPVPA